MVYMVKVSFEQKPYRKIMMKLFGGDVVASPSEKTKIGQQYLQENPKNQGSLGIAISEAVEDALSRKDTNYALGSVLNHVLLHQTIIGQEAKKQMEMAGDYPDIIIGCHGGGSNFAGISFPFLQDKLSGKKPKIRAIAVEPESCPTLTKGKFEYDFGDTAGLTPLLAMYTLGHDFMPSPIHAGGLRYHGASPIVSFLLKEKIIEAKAYGQMPVFEAAVMFAKNQGIIPAPESAHAIKAAIDEALECKKTGEAKVILFNLSGHGHFDMSSYDNYLSGKIK
jgi:tryptophan synthase beta chain